MKKGIKILYFICRINAFFMTLSGYIFCLGFAYVELALKMSHREMTIMSILCLFIMSFFPIVIPLISEIFLQIGLNDFSHLMDIGSKDKKNYTLIIQIIFIVIVNIISLKYHSISSDFFYSLISSVIVVTLLYFVKCTTFGVNKILKTQI
ncbi:MAG: hypothetical protein PUE08_00385 [Eubacteriales bacterium]|nr:hypothetical protein [Eubacteriales bacterium]